MCLLTFLPAEVAPDLTALRHGAGANPDGHGWAIVTGDRILTGRGLDPEPVLDAFDRTRRDHRQGPALFHSRLATHGRADLANCHPFTVGGDARTVIAHNGILHRDVRPRRGDGRSDTRIAAEDHLPALLREAGPLHRPTGRARLQAWLGPGNRVVMLTVDPRHRHRAYVFHEDEGIWDDGCWYSNDTYLPPRPRPHPAIWITESDGPGEDWAWRCASCHTPLHVEDPWCPWCHNCWACAAPPHACDCWTPAGVTTTTERTP